MIAQDLIGRCWGVDDNAIHSGPQDAGREPRQDADRLDDGQRAESAGIEVIDFPSALVFEIAPAKVLQGAVRRQGLASPPNPDTRFLIA